MLNNIHLSNEMVELPEDRAQHGSTQDPLKSNTMAVADAGQLKKGYLDIPGQTLAKQPESGSGAQLNPTYDFSCRTVLAVDDVAFNLDLIKLFFKKTGAKLLFAANGKEALDIVTATPDLDIVLMDIQMPVMNGLDATREIRKLDQLIPVIAITAFVHSDDKQRCFDAGCNDFLSKPCSRADLLQKVNNYFRDNLTG